MVLFILAVLVVVTGNCCIHSKRRSVNQNTNEIGAQTDYKIIGIEPGAGINEVNKDSYRRLWIG